LLKVIALASAPHERVAGTHFVPAPTPDTTIRDRIALWIDDAAGGERGVFARYRQALGWTTGDVNCAVHDASVRDRRLLPRWAEFAILFVAHQPAGASIPQHGVEKNVRISVEALARRRLPGLTPAGLRLSARARGALYSQIAGRVMQVMGSALDAESRVVALMSVLEAVPRGRETGALGLDRESWILRLEMLPVLAYALGETWAQWEMTTGEMLSRLRRDARLVAREFLSGDRADDVADIVPDLGDPHSGGRAVAILSFAGGGKVVYKPKDLAVAAAVIALIARSNALLTELPLREHKILPRDGYTWEEHVDNRACRSPRDVGRFYFRFGKILRLFEFLEGRDLWLDNLIAASDQPLFIDLETVLQGRRSPAEDTSPAEEAVLAKLLESAAPTGAIAAHTYLAEGVRAEEFGALTPVRDFLLPYSFQVLGNKAKKNSSHAVQQNFPRFRRDTYAPRIAGSSASVVGHLAALTDGYNAMSGLLKFHGKSLASVVAGIAHHPVRHIERDTWDCYKILRQSLQPSNLSDGLARERALSRLFRADQEGRSASEHRAIFRLEIEAFRALNIPFFLSRPGSRSLYGSDGREIKDFFSGTALQRLRARTRKDPVSPDERIAIVNTCLASGRNGDARLRMPAYAQRQAMIGDDEALGRAVEIGDLVLKSATVKRGTHAWLALVYDPHHDFDQLSVLENDLLSGTCGIAVLLADLFAVTRHVRFRNTALDLCEGLVASLRSPQSHGARSGGFIGPGSNIYCLGRCAAALDDHGLADTTAGLARSIPTPGAGEGDIILGLPGLALALASADRKIPVQRRDALRHVLEAGGRMRQESAYPPTARRLLALPDRAAAVRLALARLAPPAQRSVLRVGASSPSGNVLAAISETCAHAPASFLREKFALPLERLSGRRLIDLLEIALASSRVAPSGRAEKVTRKIASTLSARRRARGSWFPESLADDRHNLSIVWGVPAVAHAFLKLQKAVPVPSIRLLE
jgi:type 2 lantibiotic biosynthesis protein LanM